MAATQANRHLEIITALGQDKVLLRSASISEQLGRLFRIEVELSSDDANLSFDRVVGENAAIRLEMIQAGKTRYFNGFVSRFVQTHADADGATYRATLVPWLWFLTRTADCRIFQKMKVPDIIKKVFHDHGFDDFRFQLTGRYAQWDYCVQYRETDFNFVSRLMEQEGIYYFFEHDEKKHTLVLADSVSAHQPFSGYERIQFRHSDTGLRGKEHITSWTIEHEVQPGSYVLNDFNFEKPKTSLIAKSEKPRSHAQSQFQIYDYPGEYDQHNEGTEYSKIRIEELQAQHKVNQGESNARGIAVGHVFDLEHSPRKDQDKKYLITSASYHLTSNEYHSGGGDGELYSCSFTAIDSKEAFRAARITPKPLIQGPQTAIVVGPEGEEIYTDKYGRVKVQFHWDRYGKADENSSCWVRLSQAAWAGKKWGALSIPRIGHEVIVEFLEGDPDLPIVTGQVYNADAMPPYDLPAHKTRTTIKTNSTKGGQGFNELRFEDKKGSEQVFIHAERNQDVRVKRSSLEWIGKNRHLIVTSDQYEKVGGDKHLTIKGDQNEKIDGTLSQNIAADFQQKVAMHHAIDSGQEIHLKAGMNVVIEAGMSITLKAGGGFIVVGPAGVTISGTPVLINSGGSAGSGAGCTPERAKLPQEADNAKPGETTAALRSPAKKTPTNPKAVVLHQAAKNGTPFCAICEAAKAARMG